MSQLNETLEFEYNTAYDPFDPYACVMSWFFAIADVLWHTGHEVPAELEYKAGIAFDGDNYPTSFVLELFNEYKISEKDLLDFGYFLEKEYDKLIEEGEGY